MIERKDYGVRRSGKTICSFVIEAAYPGKTPFVVGTFRVERGDGEMETERRAMESADQSLRDFVATSLPDGTACPQVLSIRLGAMTFVPDDFDGSRQ